MKKYSTSERLKEIMATRGLKQIDILEKCRPYCEKYGVKLNKNDLSQYVSGKVIPKQDKLSVLGAALGVSEVWLMGYEESPAAGSPSNGELSDEARAIGRAYDNAEEYKKQAVADLLGIKREGMTEVEDSSSISSQAG